jgi:hypothetical protein
MIKLYDSYLDYLSANPGEFTSLILWLLTSVLITIVLFKRRNDMIDGVKGINGFMESAESVTYLMCWTFPYILNYAAFFEADLPDWVWWFMSGCIAWALGGRWLFEWALALRAGATSVTDPVVIKTVTEKKVETKEQSTTKTDEIK